MLSIEKQHSGASESCGGGIRIERTDANSTQLRYIPHFRYDAAKVGRSKYGAILVEDRLFHQIVDMDAFYAELGCDKAARNSGLCDDEFVWHHYIRDGAKMVEGCLQPKIAAYLHKHSAKFRALYGRAYDAALGTCSLSVIDFTDEHCVACPRHPPAGNSAKAAT